jgi:hypothetical protein
MMLLGAPGQAGISFLATAVLPQSNQGSYQWVQLLTGDQYVFLPGATAVTKPSAVTTCNAFSGAPELDVIYPYPNRTTNIAADTAIDSPSIQLGWLVNGVWMPWYDATRAFSATMYLMWSPGTTNAIPVPLASMDWQFKSEAINTGNAQQNTTQFILGCQSQPPLNSACHVTVPSTDADKGFPVWTAPRPAQYSCQTTGN